MTNSNTYYRAIWCTGRYDKINRAAIIFNLLEGLSFFFEDETAELIGAILSSKRGEPISLLRISDAISCEKENLISFFEELVHVGILTKNSFRTKDLEEYRNKKKLSLHVKEGEIIRDFAELSVSEAEKAYVRKVNNKVSVMMLELTYGCSEKCIHCYNPGASRNNDEKEDRNNLGALISIDRYKEIIDELDILGTFKVCLTGGDPFSYPDIWELLEYLYEKEIAFEIFTNGQALIGQEERLANLFPCYVAISIYSADSFVHDMITRIPGSLKKSVHVLEKLHQLQVPLIVKCMVMKPNFRSYQGVFNLAESFGAELQIDCRLIDSVDGDKCVSHYLRLDEEELKTVLSDSRSMYHVKGEAATDKIPHPKDEPACQTGMNNLCITPQGSLIPCCNYHTEIGNINSKNIYEILKDNEVLNFVTNLNIKEYEECGNYDYCDFCILCPGMNFSENGDPRKASENNCYYAKVRFRLFTELVDTLDKKKGTQSEPINKWPEFDVNIIKRIQGDNHYNKKLNINIKTLKHEKETKF